jgi:hypothetical protein
MNMINVYLRRRACIKSVRGEFNALGVFEFDLFLLVLF